MPKKMEEMDLVITIGIMLISLCTLLYKAKYFCKGNKNFFDLKSSKALRGFWCIVILFVHIPPTFQNIIQDIIGSFAYIGVTFFFMTSSYGLNLSLSRRRMRSQFWFDRIIKLLLPNWITNILFTLVFLICFKQRLLSNIFFINRWIVSLFICYFLFWICSVDRIGQRARNFSVCALIIVVSLLLYFLNAFHYISSNLWCVEMLGFAYGTVLFLYYAKIKEILSKKWTISVVLLLTFSLITGILYMKYKNIFFYGGYVVRGVLSFTILLFILCLNSRISIGNRIIDFLGEISYEVYLIHGYIFKMIINLFSEISSGWFILISVMLTISLAFIVHIICKKCISIINECFKTLMSLKKS